MLKVLILTGSNSPEREICLRSGAAVTAALEQAGCSVSVVDTAAAIDEALYAAADVLFPIIHGLGGEDGVLQKQFERLELHNFVGSGSASSALCFDKSVYKKLLLSNGLPTPAGDLTTANDVRMHKLTQHPFVLKPYDGGSSVDTFIVRDLASADWERMHLAVQKHGQMLLEQLITGTEITVGILGSTALPVIEIIPPQGHEFDYENKYNGSTQELCPPRSVTAATQIKAQQLALQIHNLAGCRDYSRTDMMVAADGGLSVLETNTIPGLTNQSLLPKMAACAGTDMASLCKQLVQMAAARRSLLAN